MSNDWWSRQISGNPAPSRVASTPPVTPPMRTAIRIPQQVQAVAQPTFQLEQQTVTETVGEAIRVWKGGEAHRKSIGACPECGSDHFFSFAKAGVNGVAPAPQCYGCGYNGKFSQAEQSSWVS